MCPQAREGGIRGTEVPHREHACVHVCQHPELGRTCGSAVFCEGEEGTGAPRFPGLAVSWFHASGSQMLATSLVFLTAVLPAAVAQLKKYGSV